MLSIKGNVIMLASVSKQFCPPRSITSMLWHTANKCDFTHVSFCLCKTAAAQRAPAACTAAMELVFCSLHQVHCAYRPAWKWQHSKCFTSGLFTVVQLPLTKPSDVQLLLTSYDEHDSELKGFALGKEENITICTNHCNHLTVTGAGVLLSLS